MAKPLVFEFNNERFPCQMAKVDRSRLYGYKETEVFDEEERRCELATLADDGRTILGKGGIGIGYMTVDGNWCDKTKLTPVDLEGQPMTPVGSSFSAPVPLTDKVSVEEYMNHSIRLVYQMEFEEGHNIKLEEELRNGAIYKFDYSFRGGLEPDIGFLLCNEDNKIFMTVGSKTSVDMISLAQASAIDDADETVDEDADPMDFGMI